MNTELAVEPISPVNLGNGRVLYAPGVRAGQWVFATGHMAHMEKASDVNRLIEEFVGGA